MKIEALGAAVELGGRIARWLRDPGAFIIISPIQDRHLRLKLNPEQHKKTRQISKEPIPQGITPINNLGEFEIIENGPNEEGWHTRRQMQIWRDARSHDPSFRTTARLILALKQELIKAD